MKGLERYRLIWIISLFPVISIFITLATVAFMDFGSENKYLSIIYYDFEGILWSLFEYEDRFRPSMTFPIIRLFVLIPCVLYQAFYFFKSSGWAIAPKNFTQSQAVSVNNPVGTEKSNRTKKLWLKITFIPYLFVLITPVLSYIPIINDIIDTRIFGGTFLGGVFFLLWWFSAIITVPIFIFHIIYINAKISYRIKNRVSPECFDGSEYYADTEEQYTAIPKRAAIPIFIVSGILSLMLIGGSYFLQLCER